VQLYARLTRRAAWLNYGGVVEVRAGAPGGDLPVFEKGA